MFVQSLVIIRQFRSACQFRCFGYSPFNFFSNQYLKIPSQVCGGQYEFWCYCLAIIQQPAGILARTSGLGYLYFRNICCGSVPHILDDCLCCLDSRFQPEMLILLFEHMMPSSASGKSMVSPLKVLILLHRLSR